MQSFATIFSKTVGDAMSPPPPVVTEDTSCAEAVAKMTDSKSSSLFVKAKSGKIIGILTEVDVARRVAFRAESATPVQHFMSSPVQSVKPDDMLYQAIGIMRRRNFSHLPVVRKKQVVGVLRFRSALAIASAVVVDRIDNLVHEDSVEGLQDMRGVQVEIAMSMLDDGIDATEVQALISHVNRDVHRRVVDRVLSEMFDEGLGEPPVPFSTVIMGSGGRDENFLYPDQDNGLILQDYEDEQHSVVDPYFIEFSERVTKMLDDVGFPLCLGFVMATNPIWRKSISQWKHQTSLWSAKRSTAAVRLADIFFDFVPVWGKPKYANALRDHITDLMHNNIGFLSEIAKDQRGFRPAIRAFGRFKTEPGMPRGRVNLKKGGMQMLVNAVRLLALRDGVPVTSTLARIEALERIGTFSKNEAEELVAAFSHIASVLLRHQINCFNRRETVDYEVVVSTLTKFERTRLKEALKTVQWLQERVAGDLTGDVLSS